MKRLFFAHLLKGLPQQFTSWMSHGDRIVQPAKDWEVLAVSEEGVPAILAHSSKPWFGLQFHPEVSHCEHGKDIFANFVLDICKAKPGWTMEAYVATQAEGLRKRVQKEPVVLLISGGVDSTVAAVVFA